MSAARAAAGVVTLLTDFGTRDPFVGVMKGVLLNASRELRLVDLSHEIAPGDVHAAGFWLERSYGYFPSGSVHLAVVDPGVGTERRPLALRIGDHAFVGPDNGLFTRLLDAAGGRGLDVFAHRLDADAVRAKLGLAGAPSRTFHGRDLFAPAAALLASGAELAALGAEVSVEALVRAAARPGPCVAVVDRFGNLITDALVDPLAPPRQVDIAGRRLRLAGTYGEAEPGECVALVGSFGTLEIAVRDGSAAAVLGVSAGEPVALVAP